MLVAAADSLGLHHVRRLADARGVRQNEPHARELHLLLHHVARRARHRRHDGAVKSRQKVQKRRFSDVRASDDGRAHTAPHRRARVVAGNQRVERRFRARHHAAHRRFAQCFDVLFREIDVRRQVSRQRDQLGAHAVDAAVQRPLHRGRGRRRALTRRCADQIHHGLGLRQRDAPVQKRPLRELAGSCRSRARREARAQKHLRHRAAAVARKFHHVLARVAVRRAETQRHHFVAHAPVLDKMTEHRGISLRVRQFLFRIHRAEHPPGHAVRVLARQPDHRDPARSRRRCNGCDRVFQTFSTSFPRECVENPLKMFTTRSRLQKLYKQQIRQENVLPDFLTNR